MLTTPFFFALKIKLVSKIESNAWGFELFFIIKQIEKP